MIGDHDVVNTLASVDQARAMIPAIEIEIVSDAGHILTMDQPEYVMDRIIRFLSKEARQLSG
jgi:pimeloyl-ACP methyl ester carboxylesterase